MSYLSRIVNGFSSAAWAERIRLTSERLAGVDFSTVVSAEALGLDPRLAGRSSPSGNRWLRRVLRELPIRPSDAVIDIGCGKGSAINLMLQFPFARVDGLELSPQIAQIARGNFQRLKVPQQRCSIYQGDAASFGELDGYSHLYLYNPFSAEIMRRFIPNLLDSLARAPRELTVIYNNPACHRELVEGGTLAKIAEYPDQWGNGIYLYSNRGGERQGKVAR